MAIRAVVTGIALPHVDRRFIVGGLLAAVAAAMVLVLTRPPQETPVLVAGGELPAGTQLGALDIDVRYVQNADGLIEGTSLGDLDKWVLRVPLGEGEPLLASLVLPPAVIDAPNVIALSMEPEHAVLGQISAGDRVDVYVTTSSPGQSKVTSLVAADVFVVAASVSDDPGTQGDVNVLLAVDDALALELAAAGRSDGVDLVRVSS